MNIFSDHILGWLCVLAFLGAGFYTMKIIGEEKSTFKDDSYQVTFGDLVLMIPNWWTITSQTDHELRFERTDTRYDWYAVYQYVPHHDGKDLPKLLEEKLDLEDIHFDEDVVFETDSRVLFRDPKVQEHFQEVIRVEGKASQKIVDRIYYDIYFTRAQNDSGYFMFESRSSVLNGLVEGPYFEESLSELEMKS
ncbi:MAG: hypothetical protein ACJ76H_08965 [Bacteriovoracaceae bacterium]